MGVLRLSPVSVRKTRVPPNIVVPFPESGHYTQAGVWESQYSSSGSVTVREMSETITYTTKRKVERHKSNSCVHIKYLRGMCGTSAGSALRTTFKLSPHINHYADYYAWPAHGNLAHSTAEATAFSSGQLNVAFPPAIWGSPQDDIDEVFMDLTPDLTSLSIPNFFLELKDLRKMFLEWKRKVALLNKGLGGLKKLSSPKTFAGLHLEYNFGWKPLYNDLHRIVDTLQNVMAKLKAYEDAVNEYSKSHHTFPSEKLTKSGTFTYASNHKCSWSGTVTRTRKAGLIYRILPFQVTDPYKRVLRAYLDALGFQLDPKIIWDAIPFTFVLDWFFGIGSWLENHAHDTLEIPFYYVDSYINYKETVEMQSWTRMYEYLQANQTPIDLPAWVTTRTYFERALAAPSDTVFRGAGWRQPTGRQARLLVSLGTSLASK